MPCEKLQRITQIDILANRSNNDTKMLENITKQDTIMIRSYHLLLLLLLLLVTILMLKREGDLTGDRNVS